MRIALTGVSGFLGSFIARRLHAEGHAVVGLVRPTSRRDHVERFVERFVEGDHADRSCWPDLLGGADCVVHNSLDWSSMRPDPPRIQEHLRSNLEGSILLLHESAPRQFIFISSIAVHHDIMPRPKAEDGVSIVDEDHPLRPSNEYGAYKAAVEAHLWAEHFGNGRHTSAVRPCAVYGVDPSVERSHGYAVLKELRRTGRYARPGGGKYVHVDDVAAAVSAIVGNPAAAGRPFNLVDCYARHADWALLAAELLGLRAEIDTSSPPRPANMFDKRAAQSLGVRFERGRDGIREHLRDLIARMDRG
ncbi:MAG TPA: NAD(P)-dependent oxidoreductase [Phycisphaerales bacterium]|nr:NAD(P)-dependent oxidoreductase [Phycisphaerales bacterium]